MAKKNASALPSDELAKEVRRRRRSLERKRDRLRSQLEEIDSQIAELQGVQVGNGAVKGRSKRGTTRRRRPRNQQPLGDMLASVLNRKKPMSISETAEAVQQAGYQTSASNFRAIVSNTLAKDERFKQAERGRYVLA